MKSKFKFKSEYLCIILPIFASLCVLLYALFGIKNEVEDKEYNGWNKDVYSTNYLNINNFSINKCDYKYYSPIFEIKDGNLYDYNNELIIEGMFSLFNVKYSTCDIELLFATSNAGNLYFINNVNNEKYSKYQLIKIEEVEKVINMYNDEDNNIYCLTVDGEEKSLDEIIKNYVNY